MDTEEESKIRPILSSYLSQLAEATAAGNGDPTRGLILFFQMITRDTAFDNALIRLLRQTVSCFLKLHKDTNFNDVKLKATIEASGTTVENFIENVVLKPGEPVKEPILSVVPIIFRIGIEVHNWESREVKYSAIHDQIRNPGEDGNNFEKDTIYLLCVNNDYRCLYTGEEALNFPILIKYDRTELSCAGCGKKMRFIDSIYYHKGGCTYHCDCFSKKISQITHEKFLMYKREWSEQCPSQCPGCGIEITQSDIKKFLAEADPAKAEIYRKKKRARRAEYELEQILNKINENFLKCVEADKSPEVMHLEKMIRFCPMRIPIEEGCASFMACYHCMREMSLKRSMRVLEKYAGLYSDCVNKFCGLCMKPLMVAKSKLSPCNHSVCGKCQPTEANKCKFCESESLEDGKFMNLRQKQVCVRQD